MLADDLETYLNGLGPYTSGGTTFTVRKFLTPDTPDAVITLIEWPGGKAIRAMGASIGSPIRERAGLQVLVRGPQQDYAAARDVAEQIYRKLDFLNATLSARQYFIEAMHPPMLLEQDRNHRWIMSTNFLVLKERG